jgi:hypothetical protein
MPRRDSRSTLWETAMRNSNSIWAALTVAGLAAGAGASPSLAQSPSEFTVVASGLNAPRGLKFGPDGALYIAEGGTGGTIQTTPSQCQQVPAPVGPYLGGATGTIRKVLRGKLSLVAAGFPSNADALGDLSSVADVAFLNGELYALIAGGGCSHGNPSAPNGIAKVNAATGKWTVISDLSEFAMTHLGKYDDALDFEPDGVWYSMITRHNKLLAIEPNRGIIVEVTPEGRAQEIIDISASQGHIVPTSMAERYGDLYVGNLLYFPILQNWSRVLRLSDVSFIKEGEIPGFEHRQHLYVADSKAGFTTVVAVAFGPDDLLYVLELADKTEAPAPGYGKVIRIERSGALTEVITGLNVPGGMTFGPDGALYISDSSAVPAPHYGVGRVLRFEVAFGY